MQTILYILKVDFVNKTAITWVPRQ